MYRRLVRHAAEWRPDVFVAIDFPDFNFRLARSIRRLGIPVVYYISPQLWAWRPGRMKTMREIADRVLVIFEFEKAIYERAGVPVDWVGHPLLDVMPPLRAAGHVPAQRRAGARAGRWSRCFPAAAETSCGRSCRGWSTPRTADPAGVPDVQFVVARAPHLHDDLFAPLESLSSAPKVIVEGQTDRVLAEADVAIVASGTVTVQAALHGCPMVVVYRLSPVTYRAGPALRSRRYIRDGQPRRGPASRAGTHPG